jgi:ABC-type dipeptide/oligopeptide/nickel transport system ATPase component
MGILIDYLKERLSEKQKKNCLILIVGETGSGKSYAGLRLCESFDPNFSNDKVTFKSREFIDIIDNKELSYPNAAILFEELSVAMSARRWQDTTHQMVNSLLDTFRYKRLLVVFTVPDISYVDAQTRKKFHFKFEMKGIDYKRKISKVKPLYIQVNTSTGKSYHKYLKMITEDGTRQKLKTITFGLPSKKLRNVYEKKKDKFNKELIKNIKQAMDNVKSGTSDRKILSCFVCGHRWMSRTNRMPRECPQCNSKRYNKKIF